MHVKTFRRFPMLRYLPRQEWEKRKFSFYEKEQPKYSWLKRWGKEDQRVPSDMNPSFRLVTWGVEEDPPLQEVQLVIPEVQCSFPVRSDYVTNVFTAAPLRTGHNSNRRPCQWLILSQYTLAPVPWAGVPRWGPSTIFASIDTVAMLQSFTWWYRRKEL